MLQHSCAVAVESKVENIWDKNEMEWKPSVQSTGGGLGIEQEGKETEMVFHLREQGIGDECGKVTKPIWWGKEFHDGDMQRFVRGEENVGDVVKANKFHNDWVES